MNNHPFRVRLGVIIVGTFEWFEIMDGAFTLHEPPTYSARIARKTVARLVVYYSWTEDQHLWLIATMVVTIWTSEVDVIHHEVIVE
jgi:hypothetical protein